ncbi:hypothetical protein KFU94_04220 [Chloroflexi bacterium TSY]|nr:hypothetical protein [Chloroflexi bacterium TSY]
MRYVMSIERMAEERGLEKGALENSRDNVLEILHLRFETPPESLIETIRELDNLALLRDLLKQAVLAGSLEEFERIVGVVHFSWIDRFTLLETERTFIFSDFAGSQRENGLI